MDLRNSDSNASVSMLNKDIQQERQSQTEILHSLACRDLNNVVGNMAPKWTGRWGWLTAVNHILGKMSFGDFLNIILKSN